METARETNVAKMKCFLWVELRRVTVLVLPMHGGKRHEMTVWMTQKRAGRPSLDSLQLKRVCAMALCSSEHSHLEVVFVGLRAQLGWIQSRDGPLKLVTRPPCAPETVSAIQFFAFLGRTWGC